MGFDGSLGANHGASSSTCCGPRKNAGVELSTARKWTPTFYQNSRTPYQREAAGELHQGGGGPPPDGNAAGILF
jgi:hypothetical protein